MNSRPGLKQSLPVNWCMAMGRSIEADFELWKEAADLERQLDELREKGVTEEGIAVFRRLYPVFQKIFKREE